MTVGGEDDGVDAGDASADVAEHSGVVVGDAVADGVGEVEGGGSGLDGDLADLDEKVGVGAGGVLGRELDVVDVGAGEGDHLRDLVEGLLAGDAELGGEMEVRRREKYVDAAALGRLEGAGGGLDVLAEGAGERGDGWALMAEAMARTEAASPSEAMAKPASRTSTPRAASWWAMRSFSSWCMVQPGDCSPSRRVVSKNTICSLEDIKGATFDLDVIIMHAYDDGKNYQ